MDLVILAQEAARSDIPNWAQLLGQAGLAGAVLWYFGQKLIPALLSQQADALATFASQMDKLRDANTAALTADRALREAAATAFSVKLDGVHTRITELQTELVKGSGCRAALATSSHPEDVGDPDQHRRTPGFGRG